VKKIKEKMKHILVEDSVRRELKIKASGKDKTIGEYVKELLQKDKKKQEVDIKT